MGAPRGNKNAIKSKDWEDAIRRAIAQHPERHVLFKLATRLINEGLKGDLESFKFAVSEIGNRVDGKPAQSVEISGDLGVNKDTRIMTDDELAEEAARLRAALGLDGAGNSAPESPSQLN